MRPPWLSLSGKHIETLSNTHKEIEASQHPLTFLAMMTFKSKRAKANVRICFARSTGATVDAGCLITDATATLT